MNLRILLYICFFVTTSTFARRSKIIGGEEAGRNEFPYQALIKRIATDVILCSGAMISPIFILTVATCVDDRHNSHANIKVVIGNPNSVGNCGNSFLPNRIFIHPDYTGEILQFSTIQNDIGLLRINGYIQFNMFQTRVLLPIRDVVHNQLAILSGWGTTTYPHLTFPYTLQKYWLRVISTEYCTFNYPLIYPDQFCGLQRAGVGICIGDGGSPLVSNGRLIGLASLSFHCGGGFPDVFTNVYTHLEFILFIMNRARDNIE